MPGLDIDVEIFNLLIQQDKLVESLRDFRDQGISHREARVKEVILKYNQISSRIRMLKSWRDNKIYPENLEE